MLSLKTPSNPDKINNINEIKDKMYVIIIKKYITKHYTLNLKKIMSPSLTI